MAARHGEHFHGVDWLASALLGSARLGLDWIIQEWNFLPLLLFPSRRLDFSRAPLFSGALFSQRVIQGCRVGQSRGARYQTALSPGAGRAAMRGTKVRLGVRMRGSERKASRGFTCRVAFARRLQRTSRTPASLRVGCRVLTIRRARPELPARFVSLSTCRRVRALDQRMVFKFAANQDPGVVCLPAGGSTACGGGADGASPGAPDECISRQRDGGRNCREGASSA